MGRVVGVVLAAGAGLRLGGDVPKPLVPFRGRPLAAWALDALRAGGVSEVVVVVGSEAERVAEGLADELRGAEVVACGEWAEGLSASLRCGVAAAAAHGAEAVVVVLGDQPLLTGEAVATVLAAREPQAAFAVRATYSGVPGHPTVLEGSAFTAVAELRGDTGARELLRGALFASCDGLGVPDDVDTLADLERLEAQRASRDD
jgi:CTP:molybdopterin cytidylyltransferase MocA